jgi:hypothetical protein
LVDKAKTKLVVKLEMDENEQSHCLDIGEDLLSMKLLTGGSLDGNTLIDIERAKRRDEISLAGGYTLFSEFSGF